jgi:hypothetical protein
MSKQRDYHAEYLRRKDRGRHPAEIAKIGFTRPKRSGTGAKEQTWFHRNIKMKDIKPSKNKKFQMILKADYINEKTTQVMKKFTSYSQPFKNREREKMLESAILDAQGKLGSTNWALTHIVSVRYIEWARRKRSKNVVQSD